MGRLTRDPEVRYSQGEKATAVGRFTLAVDRRFKREGEQNADFISCISFGKSAEFAEKYGSQCRGQMTMDDYQRQQETEVDGKTVDTETGEIKEDSRVVDFRAAKQA